jgi:hypothetical protein
VTPTQIDLNGNDVGERLCAWCKGSLDGKRKSAISRLRMERELAAFLRAHSFTDSDRKARALVLRALPDRQRARFELQRQEAK